MKKTFLLLSAAALPLAISSCRQTKETSAEVKTDVATAGDTTFARTTFESLAKGESSVASKIDWPVFTSLGENLGTTYTAFTSDVEKKKFVDGYISNFAINFRQSGGNLEGFTNWRVSGHDAMRTEVAADTANGVLTVTVAERDGEERVAAINLVK